MSIPADSDTRPSYFGHLRPDSRDMTTADGKKIAFYALEIPTDDQIISEWAQRFRENYRTDEEIAEDCQDMGISPSEYLLEHVFPSATAPRGPSVRAGDFAELLIADYLEYVAQYWVPRLKYANKSSPNESVQGGDVLGIKINHLGVVSAEDEMLVYEVKGALSNKRDPEPGRLQVAIDDSSKDYYRLAYTLNSTKQLYRSRGEKLSAQAIARFQNKADRPYKLSFGAAAVMSNRAVDLALLAKSETLEHVQNAELQLLVIYGPDLMDLVHGLY